MVDIGSNSVRMVVFDGAARSPAYFFNEKVMAGSERASTKPGGCTPRPRAGAEGAQAVRPPGRGMQAGPLTVVATAAMREAEDAAEFRAQVERETGLKIWVIDGQEEARLSAQGVLLGWPGATGWSAISAARRWNWRI